MKHIQSIDKMLVAFLNLTTELQHASRENLKHSIDILAKEDLKNEQILERYMYLQYMYSNILKTGVAL